MLFLLTFARENVMRASSVGIAREGYPIIGLLAVTSLVFGVLRWPLPAAAALALWALSLI